MQSWGMKRAPNYTANFNLAQRKIKVVEIGTKPKIFAKK